MMPASFMRSRGTFSALSSAAKDSLGASREVWTESDTVWCAVSTPSESTRRIQGRYASPVVAVLTCYPHSDCAAGNHITVGSTVYEILGVDSTASDIYHADLGEVV